MRHLDLLDKGAAKFFALALLFLSSLSFSALAQQKVVGGVDVDIKDYPWQVALTSSPSGSGFCGGSIIGDSWVLTAAHCVNGDSPSNLYIRVGSSDPFASGGDSYSVNQIIVHPSYSGNSYDFALVEIDGAFAFSAYVDAIDLVSPADIAAGVQDGGVMATITGWGTTSSGGSLSSTLQMVEAPIVENNVACGSSTDSNGNSGDYSCSSLDETMICAGDLIDGGEDACQGDSGGPLAVRNAANTKWLLIGATSWGYGCADVNYPGVWSKVSYVLDWIDANADTNSENGCMDATACNYDPEAIYDDGSCAELDECGDCGGDGPADGYDCDGNCTTGETLFVEMSDSYGDGWNGNNLVVNGVASTLSSGSSGSTTLCYDSSAGCVDVSCDGGSWQSEVSWIISDENGSQLLAGGAPFTGAFGGADCGPAVPGCTDELALNYNANATEDDGSCQYPIDCEGLTAVMISVGGGSYESEVSWSIGGFSGVVGDTEACLEDGCMTFNMYDSWGDGWNGNTVTIASAGGDVLLTGTLESGSEGTLSFGLNFDGECGPIYGCTDSLALNFDAEASSDDGSCTYPLAGCTDESALNYNPSATEDDGSCEYPVDCEGLTSVVVEVGGGSWAYEVTWTVGDFAGGEGITEICLEDGCHTFNMADSYGDGWNGNLATLTSNGEVVFTGTLESGSEGSLGFGLNTAEDCGEVVGPILGCTDLAAINYNPDATEDDGSCQYDSSCDFNTVMMTMNDSYGDGWNGNTYVITDGAGSVVAEGTMETGSNETDELCLDSDCYTMTVGGGSWSSEVSWSISLLSDDIMEIIAEGAAGDDFSFAINSECEGGSDVYGCTDATATNYNPSATEDDGSCEYDSSCTALDAVVTIATGSFAYEMEWSLEDAAGNQVASYADGAYENNMTYDIAVCLEEGSDYNFNIADSYGDGWNGGTFSVSADCGELVSGGLEEGDYAEFAFTASCVGGGDDAPWDVTITGSNHTIVVDGEATIDLDGMPIEIGDALGVFFTDDNGDLQCAGYVTWTGSTNSIAAQGDDSTTDEIDGFVSGSEFVWIVWDASEGVELMASASYSDAMPNQGSFVVNGISALAGLATVPPISEQLISMPEGWSMFSTYMLATDMDMQNMLSPIVDDVVIAKNNEGLAYLPEWGFNGVGDLQVGQGYQIKLLAANEITVVGEYMLPEENPIALTAGWNMIGYLRLEGADAAAILESVNASGNLIIAKDYNGSAYLPEWDFNGIGDMVPGQAYQLKINNADVLQYLSNDESYRLSSVEVTENNVSHFSKVLATDNNMTVVIEDAAWDVLPTEGSEVAAFDKAGNLIGSAIYSSPVTVVTVWGDDALTSEKEGSLVSEAVSFKVFTSGNVLDFTVTEWAEGSSTYNVDAINVASSIEINTVVADAISSDRVLVKVINVLGQEVQLNDESFKGEVLFNVYDDGSVEQFVK